MGTLAESVQSDDAFKSLIQLGRLADPLGAFKDGEEVAHDGASRATAPASLISTLNDFFNEIGVELNQKTQNSLG